MIKHILIILTIFALIEIGMLGYAYYNADEVECNLLWCNFKSSSAKTTMETNQICKVNGKEVNCSDYMNEFKDYSYHGIYEIDGICPTGNQTLQDCFEQIR